MPKVKLLTSMAGISFAHNAGDEIECDEEQALRFIKAGIAEPVTGKKVERAGANKFLCVFRRVEEHEVPVRPLFALPE